MRSLLVCAFIGCGGTAAPPDAAATGDNCQEVTHLVVHPEDFPPAEPGTLAGWDPVGRWFMTDPVVDSLTHTTSSFKIERSGTDVFIDGDTRSSATLDDTELFQLTEIDTTNAVITTARRVSNLQPDGMLRYERADCDGGHCTLCTSTIIRATHHANEGESDHLTLLGELRDPAWSGYTLNVRVAGTLAYLVRRTGLYIIDTSDPAHPAFVGKYENLVSANDVKLLDVGAKRYALIADVTDHVIDVTDPTAPVLAAEISRGSHTLFTETRDGKTLAYLGAAGGMPVYDVTDPRAPMKVGEYGSAELFVHDLSVKDGIGYLNAWTEGLQVVDFTTPAAPRLLGTWHPTPTRTSHSNWTTVAGGRHIALHGEEAYGAKLDIVDVDPASPTFMQPFASWGTRPWVSIHNIMAFGTKAYFTYYQDGVRVLDVADPAHPQQVGYFNTWDPNGPDTTSAFFEGAVGLDVDLARKLIFVADSPRGLLILRDDTP